ncbi:hypothetical protein PanWU01x14_366900 [Parasponia andersonii]|uniref:Uncharacterized protein n=1 Tax=Parasponia andersonii TaxID=3476 RepID=A0A2P5A5I3_PARAD|nr:hypothetical protein PanWU01x14_366900 [Parasponia andersonii]
MKRPLAFLALQATILINPRVLVQRITVRTHRPEAPKPRRWNPVIGRRVAPGAPSGGGRRRRSPRRRRLGPPDGQFALLGGQVDPGVKAELVVVEGLLGRVGQDGPGLGDELEGLIGKRVLVLVGVEEEGEVSVLLLDEILVVGS